MIHLFTSNKGIILTLIKRCVEVVLEVDETEPYSELFKSLVSNNLIDDDECTKEYRTGTVELYEKLVTAKKECVGIENDFDLENCQTLPSECQKMFSSLLIIACTLKNEDYTAQHFSANQLIRLQSLASATILLEKHNETIKNLNRIGIHSLFE